MRDSANLAPLFIGDIRRAAYQTMEEAEEESSRVGLGAREVEN